MEDGTHWTVAVDRTVDDPLLQRLTPEIDPLTAPYWHGGAGGRLLIGRCDTCGRYSHPPVAHCPCCLRRAVQPTAVSGRGTVLTYTVNHQQWIPGQTPFVLAVVGLEEQEDLRITSILTETKPDDVTIGLPVEVRFVHRNDVYYPVFVPRRGEGSAR
jgi:hypothetical protein